jgi:hypothetical protein
VRSLRLGMLRWRLSGADGLRLPVVAHHQFSSRVYVGCVGNRPRPPSRGTQPTQGSRRPVIASTIPTCGSLERGAGRPWRGCA